MLTRKINTSSKRTIKNKLLFAFLLATLTFTIIETIVLLINPFHYEVVSPLSIFFSLISIIAVCILKFIFHKNTKHSFIMIVTLVIQLVSLCLHIGYTYVLTAGAGYFCELKLINPLVIKLTQIKRDLNTDEVLATKDFFFPYLNILNVLVCFLIFFLLNKTKKSQELDKQKKYQGRFINETIILLAHSFIFLLYSIFEIILFSKDKTVQSIYYTYGYYAIIISSIYLLILIVFYKKIALNRKLLLMNVSFMLISQIISYVSYRAAFSLLNRQGPYSINTSFIFPFITKITYKTWSYETLMDGKETIFLPYLCLLVALLEIVIIFVINLKQKSKNK